MNIGMLRGGVALLSADPPSDCPNYALKRFLRPSVFYKILRVQEGDMSPRTYRLSLMCCVKWLALALILAPLMVGVCAFAQTANGRVIGTVTDPQGAAVAGAKVTVTDTGTNNGGDPTNGYNGISIAGGRADAVTYVLDGAANNSVTSNQVVFNPNPDTVAEFRILSNNYTAEYGRNGGGTVSVVTKSGTNH